MNIFFRSLCVQCTYVSKFFLLSFRNRLWGRILALDSLLPVSSVHTCLYTTSVENKSQPDSVSPIFWEQVTSFIIKSVKVPL